MTHKEGACEIARSRAAKREHPARGRRTDGRSAVYAAQNDQPAAHRENTPDLVASGGEWSKRPPPACSPEAIGTAELGP